MNRSAIEAMRFAIQAHSGQVRKYTGEPYWKHLAEVAGIVATATGEQHMITAAWLHDVVEDTEVRLADVHDNFGYEVARLVSGLTDVSKPADGNRERRKAIDRLHIANGCHRVQTIKCADLISNTGSIVVHDKEFARVYLKEKRALLEVMDKADPDLLAAAWKVWADAVALLSGERSDDGGAA
ncbi:hypothetical protein GCM10011348_46050 [Marinobacterium nitratireducens]|uniref:HD/PDEase domain-containing protein n=1 Tax=Marinobacterium nitratireducens TaxID=518897 RepID=A0A918DZ30_9GAMM|nr:HD domain-containing protein [Marinobacterium nitratireducens]GGO89097.1 hypothetical protein GCM10011348_46050 [Marinobacterium nitratireducens]